MATGRLEFGIAPPPGDDLGRGREYWQERARMMRDERRAAELALTAARTALAEEQDAVIHGRTLPSSQRPLAARRRRGDPGSRRRATRSG